jgi:hypothetical protein
MVRAVGSSSFILAGQPQISRPCVALFPAWPEDDPGRARHGRGNGLGTLGGLPGDDDTGRTIGRLCGHGRTIYRCANQVLHCPIRRPVPASVAARMGCPPLIMLYWPHDDTHRTAKIDNVSDNAMPLEVAETLRLLRFWVVCLRAIPPGAIVSSP